MNEKLHTAEAGIRGAIIEDAGLYYAKLGDESVQVSEELAKTISKFLRAQERIDKNEDTTATRLTKKVSDSANCHVTASKIAGFEGAPSDIRRAGAIIDHIEEAGVEIDISGIGQLCEEYDSLKTLIQKHGEYPVLVLQSSYGVPIHSFVVLGESSNGEILIFEKVNKGSANPWQLRLLKDFYAENEQHKKVAQFATATF